MEIYTNEDEIILKKHDSYYCQDCETSCGKMDIYCRHCGRDLKITGGTRIC